METRSERVADSPMGLSPPGRRYRRAKHRVAQEVQVARSLLAQAMRSPAAHPASEGAALTRFYDPVMLDQQIEWAKGLPADSRESVLSALRKAHLLGPDRQVAPAPDPSVLDALSQDFPNFDAVTRFVVQRLHLCRVCPEQHLKLAPMLLNGPPGVGKTAYCRSLAVALGLRFEVQDLAQDNANFAMLGLDVGYATGKPGRIWQSLMHESVSMIWLLDELDKAAKDHRYGGVDHLLGLLEPVTAGSFTDASTQLPINASWIAWVATCNSLDGISPPLRSRFEVFEIGSPTAEQMVAVIRSVQRDIHAHEHWARAFRADLVSPVIDALSAYSPRVLRRALINAYARAAAAGRREIFVEDIVDPDVVPSGQRRMGFV